MKLKNARATDTDIHLNEKKKRSEERKNGTVVVLF